MKRWLIPLTLTEYGREAIVEAETKAEAIRKFRANEWDELTDSNRWKVTKIGAAHEVEK